MADNPKRPGLRSGIEGTLEEGFGVTLKPTESDRAAIEAIREKARSSGIECEALWLSDAPVRRGALFNADGQRVEFPQTSDRRYDRCLVALVDPDRMARWGHGAWFAFYPADGSGPVELVASDVPAHGMGGVRLEPTEQDS